MSILVSVDPGVEFVALARFEIESKLFLYVEWTRIHNCYEAALHARTLTPDHVIVEQPVVYGGKSKGDPNDLIDLARVAGACESVIEHTSRVKPAEWKGQMPKDVCGRRVRSRLKREELITLDACLAPIPKSRRHNPLDAVGIGLWALGRF